MAEYISFQPTDFFSPLIYTGTGSSNAVTGVGFQPDFTWIKNRDAADFYVLTDSVRGATKYLESNATTTETTNAESLKSFDADGFTVGTMNEVNTNTEDFVSWNWKAGTTSGIATNGSTTITPSSYSFNQTSGMSVIAYTGNSINDGQKVPHGLGATPDVIIVKHLTGSSQWSCYFKSLGNTKAIVLNTTAAPETDAGTGSYNYWYRTDPDSVNFTIGSSHYTNPSRDVIAYCFTSKKGYSKFGSYEGNGNADGTFVYTGFRPAFIMVKTTGTNVWLVMDNKRSPYNVMNEYLKVNNTEAESDDEDVCDFLSNGFKFRASNGKYNASSTYIYAAFAEFPIVSSNDIPGVAR